jgi:hypothetical protein
MPLQIYTKSIKFQKYYDFFGINSVKIDIFLEYLLLSKKEMFIVSG